MTTLFFATDVHGSDICWKKFINAGKFYKAEILILGGDMTGKAIVPIIHQGGDTYKAVLLQQEFMLHGQAEVDDMSQKITSRLCSSSGHRPSAASARARCSERL